MFCNFWSRRAKYTGVLLWLLLLVPAVSYPQKPNETNSGMVGNEQIQGRVFFPAGDRSSARPVIKLQSLSSPEITGVTDHDGNFRFTHLRPDEYTVIVDAGDQYEKGMETVSVGNSGAVPAQGVPGQYAVPLVYQVQIYLKPRAANAVGAPAEERLASVPDIARDLFRKGVENARKGNHHKAIELLSAAISHAPKFTLAYNELAVQYLRVGEGARAVELLKEAAAINPSDFTLRLNYGLALLNQKKFREAEVELREASGNKKGNSQIANYYLGVALLSQHKTEDAQLVFESLIKNGGEGLALAHRYLGGIYWRNKKYRDAANELETYLKLDPKVADADKIRDTIRELRAKG